MAATKENELQARLLSEEAVWDSVDWARLGEAKRNPLKKGQLARLWTPRARVTELGRGRNERRGVPADLLHTPQSAAREKTLGCSRRKGEGGKKKHLVHIRT